LGLQNNQLTGAASGICQIVGQLSAGECALSPNPAWTDGTLCPTCLNTGSCNTQQNPMPITCTCVGVCTPSPTLSPTPSPTLSPTLSPTNSPLPFFVKFQQ
jgi:hypothetical protein